MDNPVLFVNNSKALIPANELPLSSRHGDQTAIDISPGITPTTAPPTPLFAGSPTRYAKSPTLL